jgi:hypothetical protein
MNGRFWHFNGIFGVLKSGNKGVIFAFYLPLKNPGQTEKHTSGNRRKKLVCRRWQARITLRYIRASGWLFCSYMVFFVGFKKIK